MAAATIVPSLPTVLFSHSAARVVKSVPPCRVPELTSGSGSKTFLGSGTIIDTHKETLGEILEDWSGSLQLVAVPNPELGSAPGSQPPLASETAGSLMISIEQPFSPIVDRFGSQPRHILPFRSYAHGQSLPEGAASRPTHRGLGAGPNGVQGGSFWFVEDIQEEGALARFKNEAKGKEHRAIWTVWIFGASPALVESLRLLLDFFPSLPPSLPPWLQSQPSVGARSALLPHDAVVSPEAGDKELPEMPTEDEPEKPVGEGNTSDLGLQDPVQPVRPPILRTLSSDENNPQLHRRPSEADLSRMQAMDRADRKGQIIDRINASVGSIPALGEPRVAPRNAPSSDSRQTTYRNSIVAVNDETGAVIGILAQDVRLSEIEGQTSEGSLRRSIFSQRDEADASKSSGSVIRLLKKHSRLNSASEAHDESNSMPSTQQQPHPSTKTLPVVSERPSEIPNESPIAAPMAGLHIQTNFDINRAHEDTSSIPLAGTVPNPRRPMQGGTVLLEFLSGARDEGGARLNASLLSGNLVSEDSQATELEICEHPGEGTGSILSLIPALPYHFFALLMGRTTSMRRTLESESSDSRVAPAGTGTLTSSFSSTFSEIAKAAASFPYSIFNWFSSPARPCSLASASDIRNAENETSPRGADVATSAGSGPWEAREEWELAIPDFDPASLASTPRPVYRRKRPMPSLEHGFNVQKADSAAPKEGDVTTKQSAIDGDKGKEREREHELQTTSSTATAPSQPYWSASSELHRYSIIHFDDGGIGRRAFFVEDAILAMGL